MKPIKTAAICGIIIATITILSFFIGFLNTTPIFIIKYTILAICSVLFFYGFFAVGRKYKVNSLKVVSIYFIIYSIISSILLIYASFYINEKLTAFFQDTQLEETLQQLNKTYGGVENIPEDVLKQELQPKIDQFKILIPKIFKAFILFMIIHFLLYGLPTMLFGISLLKLKNKVKYSKNTGVLNIIGGITTIILIGYLLLLIAFIFEIIMLFQESKKEK